MDYMKVPVVGQNKDYYYVDTNGEVWKNAGKSRVFPRETSEGFKIVDLVSDHHRQTVKPYYVHQLVADAFLPLACPGDVRSYVGFKDGVRSNCAVENLYRYDMWEADRDVKEVYVCKETGDIYKSLKEAAEATGSNPNHISDCCKGRLKSTNHLHWEKGLLDITRHEQRSNAGLLEAKPQVEVSEDEIKEIIAGFEC